MLCTQKAAEVLQFGTHGSTYGGNPLACAVGEAVLDIVNTPAVLAGVESRAKQLREGLDAIGKRYHEGDTMAEGPRIIAIVPEGLVLDWQGEQVLYAIAR